jgi:hypothetical protein
MRTSFDDGFFGLGRKVSLTWLLRGALMLKKEPKKKSRLRNQS